MVKALIDKPLLARPRRRESPVSSIAIYLCYEIQFTHCLMVMGDGALESDCDVDGILAHDERLVFRVDLAGRQFALGLLINLINSPVHSRGPLNLSSCRPHQV